MRPVIQAAFLGGLLFLYSLGQGRSNLRWTWGPPLMRITCWAAYALVLSSLKNVTAAPFETRTLAVMTVLVLVLFGTTHWSLIRCFGASRRHITDGHQDAQRDQSLASMLRAVGLARGAAVLLTVWLAGAIWCRSQGADVCGQDLAMTTLLVALGLTEAVTALVFGERNCHCCATPAAASSMMFSRSVGLGLVVAGWSGLLSTEAVPMEMGTIVFALAVLSSGSPATLPIQLRPVGSPLPDPLKNRKSVDQALTKDIDKMVDRISNKDSLSLPASPLDTRIEPMSIEVSKALTSLIHPEHGQVLCNRVASVRRHVKNELGYDLDRVGIRQNLQLRPNTYVIKMRGVEVARSKVYPDQFLAIGPEKKLKRLLGERTVDPTYGMPGVWIWSEDRETAENYGCMIFDAVSVIATQFTEMTRANAHELLGIADVVRMLDELDKPALVSEACPKRVSLVELRDILKALLAERVSVRDLETILETLASPNSGHSFTERLAAVRVSLCRGICAEYTNNEGTINVLTLDPKMETVLQDNLQITSEGEFLSFDPHLGQSILHGISAEVEILQEKGLLPIILCSPPIRSILRKLTSRSFPNLVLLSWNEIAEKVNVYSVAMIRLDQPIQSS